MGERIEYRVNGTSIEYPNGNKVWCLYSQRHRIDGPAVEWANGDKEWWVDGKRHRVDGPAIERADGTKEWWVNGAKLSEQYVLPPEIKRRTTNECLVFHEIPVPNQKYRICSFSEEHVFTLEGLTGFQKDRCFYCQHPLIEEVYIQE
jgi:hypothetical protein